MCDVHRSQSRYVIVIISQLRTVINQLRRGGLGN